jgi:hypothetical protein
MNAIREGNIIRISADIGRALSGIAQGYRITLHDAPGVVFEVESEPGQSDYAIEICVRTALREGRKCGRAATYQWLG